MQIVAITRVLNEADIIESFVRHTARFVGHHILMDNGSTDGTIDILAALKREGVPLGTTYENYRGLLIVEIAGAATPPLLGNAANFQDGLPQGTNNVTSTPIAIAAYQTPALMLAVSMNTSGGSSDIGGSGYGGPAAGSDFTQVAQFWNWGLNLATFETATIPSFYLADGGPYAPTTESIATLFSAPDTDSYVTVAAIFLPSTAPPARCPSFPRFPIRSIRRISRIRRASTPKFKRCTKPIRPSFRQTRDRRTRLAHGHRVVARLHLSRRRRRDLAHPRRSLGPHRRRRAGDLSRAIGQFVVGGGSRILSDPCRAIPIRNSSRADMQVRSR
jgi:hypothetical protein